MLAFDFGLRRIGVAVGDAAIGIAHPLETIAAEDNRRRFEAMGRYAEAMAPVPVYAVLHPQPGLLGAAMVAGDLP